MAEGDGVGECSEAVSEPSGGSWDPYDVAQIFAMRDDAERSSRR
jgi:hypothetical protein